MPSIQWFPGHMHLTRQAIAERMRGTDVVIEMLDARLPGSSANPLLAELTRGKPRLQILNKQDLADPVRTALWLAHYTVEKPGHRSAALALDTTDASPAARLMRACRELAPHRGSAVKPLRVLICGIPNVGKSTLINRLAGKRVAKAADEAGVTKAEQRIALDLDFYLYDTPGMLWPHIIVPESGYHLAASGAVGRNAYDDDDVAYTLAERLQAAYLPLLRARYGDAVEGASPPEDVLAQVARQRGALLPGGRPNVQKAAEGLIHDFRSGALGRITLETPAEFTAWLKVARAVQAERRAEREARQADQVRQHSGVREGQAAPARPAPRGPRRPR